MSFLSLVRHWVRVRSTRSYVLSKETMVEYSRFKSAGMGMLGAEILTVGVFAVTHRT